MKLSRSPVLELEAAIAACPFRIAPERERELATLCDLNNLTICLSDEPAFNVRIRLDTREIVIGVAALEFLWASAHAHLILYNEYCRAQRTGADAFDTGGTERSQKALELLAWADRNISSSGDAEWPTEFPRPERFPAERSDGHVANELFLCALAWIIHHEIAHARLHHQPLITTCSIAEEKEADVAATRWILDMCRVPQEARKCTFGIAATILALQGFLNPDQFVSLKTHPSTFERIDYCLTAAGVPEDDEVFAFAAVTMQIQLAFRGIDKKFDGNNFRELCSEYLLEFARNDG